MKKSNASHVQPRKTGSEHQPLMLIKFFENMVGVSKFCSWWFEAGDAGEEIFLDLTGRVEPSCCHAIMHLGQWKRVQWCLMRSEGEVTIY